MTAVLAGRCTLGLADYITTVNADDPSAGVREPLATPRALPPFEGGRRDRLSGLTNVRHSPALPRSWSRASSSGCISVAFRGQTAGGSRAAGSVQAVFQIVYKTSSALAVLVNIHGYSLTQDRDHAARNFGCAAFPLRARRDLPIVREVNPPHIGSRCCSHDRPARTCHGSRRGRPPERRTRNRRAAP
jgi:hypothetical protein